MAVPSYTTLANFKLRIGVTVSTYDTVLTEILEGVGAAINAYLGFDPTETSITEYLDSNGQEVLYLKRWPVTAVSAVYEDDQAGNYGQGTDPFPASTLLTQGSDYVWDIASKSKVGRLIRLLQFWPLNYEKQVQRLSYLVWYNRGCVKCQYTVDNADLLLACREAAYTEAAARFKAMQTGMGVVLSETIDAYTYAISATQRTKTGQEDSADKFVSPMTAGNLKPFALSRLV